MLMNVPKIPARTEALAQTRTEATSATVTVDSLERIAIKVSETISPMTYVEYSGTGERSFMYRDCIFGFFKISRGFSATRPGSILTQGLVVTLIFKQEGKWKSLEKIREPTKNFRYFNSDVDECKVNNPCKNGATCVNSVGGYSCQCPANYKGQHCEEGI